MTVLTGLAFILYLAAAVCYAAVVLLITPAVETEPAAAAPGVGSWGRLLLWGGIVAQFAAVGAWCVTTHGSPFASEYGTIAVLAWVIALAFAALDLRVRMPAVGAIAMSVACIVLFWGLIHANSPIARSPILGGRIVSLHVLAILSSIGLFALAFGSAALYLLENRLLKEHRMAGIWRRIPSLETLDSIGYHSVAFGLPLLTLGLALGYVYALHSGLSIPLRAWLLDPRLLLSLVAWVMYICYLTARLVVGWRGVKLQYILLMGLVIALALYIVPTSTHHFS